MSVSNTKVGLQLFDLSRQAGRYDDENGLREISEWPPGQVTLEHTRRSSIRAINSALIEMDEASNNVILH
jgi:hypothetical protein